jgi:hypothetical protein
MSKAKKLLIVAGAALVGVVLLVVGWGEYRASKKLQAEGKTTIGEVTEAHQRRGRKGRRSYYLTVNFKTEAGQDLSRQERVTSGVYRDAVEARSVNVTYLPSDPNVCAFGPKVKTQASGIIFGVIALAVGGFTLFKGSSDDENGGAAANPEEELLADNSKYDEPQDRKAA